MVVKATEPKNEVKTDIELTIEEEAYVSMMTYAHMFSPNECSGTGLVERIDFTDGSVKFNVVKVFLPNQQNTGSTTDIPEEEMAKVHAELVMQGYDSALHKFHWHSHVDMSVFHSGTDDSNYDDMKTGDYAVSLVVNKKYDMLGSVHLYEPLRIDVLNIEVEPPDIDLKTYEIPKDLSKVLAENVARVHKYEEDNKPKWTSPWGGYKHGKSNHAVTPYNNNGYQSFGMGLVHDPDFEALLVAGEKENIIMLLRDEVSNEICGYMNLRTHECYELTSYLDYVNY